MIELNDPTSKSVTASEIIGCCKEHCLSSLPSNAIRGMFHPMKETPIQISDTSVITLVDWSCSKAPTKLFEVSENITRACLTKVVTIVRYFSMQEPICEVLSVSTSKHLLSPPIPLGKI